jgi:hypothetical protein
MMNRGLILFFLIGLNLFSFSQDLSTIKSQKPFEIKGSLSIGSGYYSSYGFNSTRKPFSYSFIGAPVVSVYGVQIPFNITVSEGSKQVNNPFTQFGINPYYKWVKVYAGWTNMSWSPTSLNGKTFLGGGIEINPGLLRAGFMYGRLNPAIKEDTLKPNYITPVYKRMGMGAKIGIGKANNFVDLIVFKGIDIKKSIPEPNDILNNGAMENALVGIISKQSFFKQKLVWDIDATVSAITRDINAEVVAIGNGLGSNLLTNLITPRLSTSYAIAAHSALSYRFKNAFIGGDYSRIEPEYQSMGVDYILNDQEKYMLKQSFTAMKKKINFNLSEFYQYDDLNGRKAVKTLRSGFSSNVNLNLTQKFGVSGGYNFFNINQQNGLKRVGDSTKLSQIQHQIMISPRYTFYNEKFVQSLFVTWTYQTLTDNNKFTEKYTSNTNSNTNLGYMLALNKIGLSISPMLSFLNTNLYAIKIRNVTPTINVNKAWLKSKLNTGITFALTMSNQSTGSSSNTLVNNIQVSYSIDKHHTLRFSNNIMRNNSSLLSSGESRGELFYIFTF